MNTPAQDSHRRQESKPTRPTFNTKNGGRKEFKKDSRRDFKMDVSRLRRIQGSTDKMWDSADGNVTNVRLPCLYHKHLGATPEECLNSIPRHCFECSRPNKIAPPVQECKGRHQYRPPAPRKPREGRRQ